MIRRRKEATEESSHNQTKRNGFGLPNIVLPAEVIFNNKLTWREKALFGFINNLTSNENGYCWASNRYLSLFIQVRPETVSTMISKLNKEGYITLEYETEYNGNQIRRIYIDKNYTLEYKDLLQKALRKIVRPHKRLLKNPPAKLKQPPLKTLSNIESNIDIDLETTNSSLLRKDGVFGKHQTSVNKIISFWNTFPETQTHSIPETETSFPTKLYKTIHLQIENLLCGKPLVRNKDNSPSKPFLDFVEEYSIPHTLWRREWKTEEIKNILQKAYDDRLHSGDMPSLDRLFWNAFAKRKGGGFSLFLHIANQITIPPKYLTMTSKLADIVGRRIKQNDKKTWAQELQRFIEDEEIPEDEINDALSWYKKHFGKKYVPEIGNPEELQKKYRKLIRAMNRPNKEKELDDAYDF